jgi:predicted nucleic acid-binding protein
VSRAIADTSVFIAREAERPLGATLGRVRATYPLLPIDDAVASGYARLADRQPRTGRKPCRHDTWIAATALRHHSAVLTQDRDFSAFDAVEVIHV